MRGEEEEERNKERKKKKKKKKRPDATLVQNNRWFSPNKTKKFWVKSHRGKGKKKKKIWL